jgi:hypothetical protein
MAWDDWSPRARLRRWWLSRLPLTDRWTLGQRNVYILPTRAGLTFAATLIVMLLAALNYQLNLGYALTFLLAGAGLVSMHTTHGALRGLTLHLWKWWWTTRAEVPAMGWSCVSRIRPPMANPVPGAMCPPAVSRACIWR